LLPQTIYTTLPAKVFLEAGIDVICDKPLTTTLDDALDLAETVKRTGLVFGLTHNYTGHPMVRQAREMVMSGELGPIRLVQVEYAQDWLATPLEKTGHKQAEWRTDPTRSGPGGSLGDIGTHAFNLACFVTGLSCKQVAADVTTFVPGRRLDDNVRREQKARYGRARLQPEMKTICVCECMGKKLVLSGARRTRTNSVSRL